MNTLEYGYGHTKEAASLVRETLKTVLKDDMKKYDLKISVRKADSGYGGPRVEISTSHIELDKRYEYIIDDEGNYSDSGTLVDEPVSNFRNGRPDYRARLVTPELLEALNSKIKKALAQFGKDEDDAMTDYFNNTMPLFYGVDYRGVK